MKKFYFLLMTGLFLVSAACNQFEADLIEEAKGDVINITSVSAYSDIQTKTVRNSDMSVSWLPGDEINLFYGGSSSKFTSTNTTTSSFATFSGTLNAVIGSGEGEDGITYFYGLYPYDPNAYMQNNKIYTTVKSVQEAVPNSFADDTFVTVAKSQNTNLSFYNLCGGIKFSLKHSGVKTVTIRGRNNENIAGEVEVQVSSSNTPRVSSFVDGEKEITLVAPDGGSFTPGVYYLAVVLPTAFENGLEMVFDCATERGVYTRASSTTINRSKFGVLTSVDKNVVYESTLPSAPVTYSISKTLSNCTIDSNVSTLDENNSGFNANIEFNPGYDHFDYVDITMGGVAHNEYLIENNGEYSIAIPEVTGDVFITLTAGEIGFENIGSFTLVNAEMASFISNATASYTDTDWSSNSLVTKDNRSVYHFGQNGDLYDSGTNVTANDRPLPVNIPLTGYNGTNVTVSIYNDEDLNDHELTVYSSVANNKVEVYNLIPNRSYWCLVSDVNGLIAKYTFQTSGARRIIKLSDTIYADRGNNFRDIGGLMTDSGATLKYNKVFRGTNIDEITTAEKALFTGYLGITREVDLRAQTHEKTRNVACHIITTDDPSNGITATNCDLRYFTGYSDMTGDKLKNQFTDIINELSNGGSIYVHCFAGADRTAYICMLIEAVCGVSLKDCTIDYELTSFSCVGVRDRRGILKNEAGYKGLQNIAGYTGSTTKEKAENILKGVGITDNQIEALRSALIEGYTSE